MKLTVCILSMLLMSLTACNKSHIRTVSFYRVPLVCGMDSVIGCGSRIKPLFIETGKEKSIKESWTNREGTIIAIVWNGKDDEELIQSIFHRNKVEAKPITDAQEVKKVTADFKMKDKWLQGMNVDQLSIHEAGTIATSATKFAKDKGIITENESIAIKSDIENYFKKDLVKVRTIEELSNQQTDDKWMKDIYYIYVSHIGKERADSAKWLYMEYREELAKSKDACCNNKEKKECCTDRSEVFQSEITCPNCGYKKIEVMPSDVCVIRYACEKCKTELTPKHTDCCVFCSYGSNPCPSKQS